MAAPTVYKSTDASAPVLSGTVGSMIAVLDACLVNGYGSKAAAGWTVNLAGTNRKSWKAPAGNRFVLDVNDNGVESGAAKETLWTGWVTLTAFGSSGYSGDTGTGVFPNFALSPGATWTGFNGRKSTTADATARAWLLLADDRTVIMCVATGDTAGKYCANYFGDVYSIKTGDTHNGANVGGGLNSATVGGLHGDGFQTSFAINCSRAVQQADPDGTNNPANISLLGLGQQQAQNATSYPLTGSYDARLYPFRYHVSRQSSGFLRGWLRGCWALMNAGTGVNDGDTFAGTGELAGRQFLVVKQLSNGVVLALETTAWDTSS